jgi:hypothetical protein
MADGKRGRPKGLPRYGGRQKGTPNKSTAAIKELAQTYGPDVITRLAEIALRSSDLTAAISASKELLDRGYGKSTAIIGTDGSADFIPVLVYKVSDNGTVKKGN